MTLLERLAAIVPPPRAHLVVYHGALAPAAALRPEIVPRDAPVIGEPEDQDLPSEAEPQEPTTRSRNYLWAELMLRVFAIDVQECPCGGRRSVIAVITDPGVIAKILHCLGLSSTNSARSPPIERAAPESLVDSTNDLDMLEPRFVPDPG